MGTATILVVSLAVSLLAHLPARVLPAGARTTYAELWPQSWAFFAQAADGDIEVVYEAGAGQGAGQVASLRQAAATNLGGLRWVSRTQLVELSYLIRQVPQQQWRTCPDVAAAGCWAAVLAEPARRLRNPFAAATLCGAKVLAVENAEQWVPGHGHRAVGGRLALVYAECAGTQ